MALPLQNLPKHQRYASAYNRLGFFWGLGIEHETYLATSQTRTITSFEGQMKPERYCVSYYDAYKAAPLQTMLQHVIDLSGSLTVPILLNSHSLTKCDVSGEHATVYSKTTLPNPGFSGTSIFEYLCHHSPWLEKELGASYMWDGDTIEFMTQHFYRATVADVIAELQGIERHFEQEINRAPAAGVLQTHGPLRLVAPLNPPWATYLTNPSNVSMFNNGTIHINITLPTQLGFNKKPLWPIHFVEQHRRLARLIQWLEPLWICVYGAPDPFSEYSNRFAAGSQRLAVSRYIGLGTFDTELMPRGKILQVPRAELSLPWYDRLYAATDYTTRADIGLDINFNKHWSHGLELRFFDQMPLPDLQTVMEQLVILMDITRESENSIPNPRNSVTWRGAAYEALHHGSRWIVTPTQLAAFAGVIGILEDAKEPLSPASSLQWIFERLERRRGFCWDRMVNENRRSSCC